MNFWSKASFEFIFISYQYSILMFIFLAKKQ